MRVLYVETSFDHHSLPIAECLHDLLPDGQFAYAAVNSLCDERLSLGWSSGGLLPWMMYAFQLGPNASAFQEWWSNADIVLCAPRLYWLMKQRMRRDKYVFYTSERWFKPPIGRCRLMHPSWALHAFRYRQMARSRYMHYLAIGPYAADDMAWFCPMAGRLWSFGYFTAQSTSLDCCTRYDGFRVLWAGRMLKWKCVETLLRAFAQLVSVRGDSKLTLIGEGEDKEYLIRTAAAILPKGSYVFLPSVAAADIREHMRDSHVYVLPSNGYEGWGAVVGEAMAEGLTVVASEGCGAAKALITDLVNGRLFQSGDVSRLANILCELSGDSNQRQRLAAAGKETIDTIWSPSTAAHRFLSVADALLSNYDVPRYNDGPMRQL